MSTLNTQSIFVDGLETVYLDVGPKDGTPVVLLHDGAWGASGRLSWGGVIPRLAPGYRILVPDLLGFGQSAKWVRMDSSPYDFRIGHLLALLETLDISEPVHVIGSSFGGSMALNMLPSHWHRLASVMSISGTGGPWRTAFGRQTLTTWDGTEVGLRRIVEVLTEPSDEFDIDEHVRARLKVASLPGHYRAMTAPAAELPASLRRSNAEAAAWPSQLEGIGTSVMLVHGKRDRLLDMDWTSHLAEVLVNCTVVQRDGSHSPNLDAPSYMATLIDDWVTSVTAKDEANARI